MLDAADHLILRLRFEDGFIPPSFWFA